MLNIYQVCYDVEHYVKSESYFPQSVE